MQGRREGEWNGYARESVNGDSCLGAFVRMPTQVEYVDAVGDIIRGSTRDTPPLGRLSGLHVTYLRLPAATATANKSAR